MYDPFEVLGLPACYDVAAADIEAAYLKAQQCCHPDGFQSTLMRGSAEKASARINTAYQQMKDPMERAASLLKRAGYWPVPEDPSIVAEIFRIHEEGDNCGGALALAQSEAELRQAFEDQNFPKAQKAYLRLTYLGKMKHVL